MTRTMLNTKHLLEGSNEDIFKAIQDELLESEERSDEDDEHCPPEEKKQHKSRRRRQHGDPHKLDVREYKFGK